MIATHRLTRLAAIAALPLALAIASPTMVRADDDIDFEEISKEKVLNCLHPTVRAESAQIERMGPPRTEGDITTQRMKIYYQGLIRRNNVEFEFLVRRSGSIRQMRVQVLSDTSPPNPLCSLTGTNWTDF